MIIGGTRVKCDGKEVDDFGECPWHSPDAIQITVNDACKTSTLDDGKTVVVEKDGKEVVSIRFPDGYRIYDFIQLFELAEMAVERIKSYSKKEEK